MTKFSFFFVFGFLKLFYIILCISQPDPELLEASSQPRHEGARAS
jgi:hypothetical protein